jgi:hypothetical protein
LFYELLSAAEGQFFYFHFFQKGFCGKIKMKWMGNYSKEKVFKLIKQKIIKSVREVLEMVREMVREKKIMLREAALTLAQEKIIKTVK